MAKIVACPERHAAEAGMELLLKGGNAVDAVVAGSLAQGVTNPSLCSLGGNGQLNVFRVRDKKPIFAASDCGVGSKGNPSVFNYVMDPKTINDVEAGPVDKNHEDVAGYKSTITPDLLQVLFDVHKRYGRLPWESCVDPAIRLAAEGFELDAYVASKFKEGFSLSGEAFPVSKEIAKVFLKGGRPYEQGEVLVQSDLANTLRQVAEFGADVFFRGAIGDMIAQDLEKNGALVTGDDLRRVTTTLYEPLSSTYKEYTFYVNIPPSGGPFKLEMLNVLEGFDLKKLGWNTPEYLNVLARAMNIALADKYEYGVDPIYDPESMDNARMMISKDYAAKIIDMIKKGRDGDYPGPNVAPYNEGTTHIITLDDDGNCVSMKHSSGDPLFFHSRALTPGVGVVLNNHMENYGFFVGHKRTKGFGFGPRMKFNGGLSPTLGFIEGKLFSASGSPAGHIGYMCEVQVLMNIIEFGFNVQGAISSPRIYSGNSKNEVVLEPNFPYPYPWKSLEALGFKIKVTPYTGRVSALVIDPKTGIVDAGTDPRGGAGLAVAM